MPRMILPRGTLDLPVFLPDATRGVVRGVDADDLRRCGIKAIQTNVFHLMQRPGSTTVRALGGLHRMMGWDGPLVTDSGGFQAYSLLREGDRHGSVSDRGLVVHPEGTARKLLLTPEKCIQLQLSYGADIAICLDDCTHPDESTGRLAQSVQRTVTWARRCKDEFERILARTRPAPRPLLFAVVQGGSSRELRRRCAEGLLEIGFDGYGFGGWPMDEEGGLIHDMLGYTRSLIPAATPMHALGIGHPSNVAACVRMGYGLLDSVLPARDARRGRLYAWAKGPHVSLEGECRYVYIQDAAHTKCRTAVSPDCTCPTCATYSVGYLHHLYAIGDSLYQRLATMHNLHFMTELMARLRNEILMPGQARDSD